MEPWRSKTLATEWSLETACESNHRKKKEVPVAIWIQAPKIGVVAHNNGYTGDTGVYGCIYEYIMYIYILYIYNIYIFNIYI